MSFWDNVQFCYRMCWWKSWLTLIHKACWSYSYSYLFYCRLLKKKRFSTRRDQRKPRRSMTSVKRQPKSALFWRSNFSRENCLVSQCSICNVFNFLTCVHMNFRTYQNMLPWELYFCYRLVKMILLNHLKPISLSSLIKGWSLWN